MVDPKIMCRRHLLGEHVEIHMLVGTINRLKSIRGFLDKGLVEPQSIEHRHASLVTEMTARGYNHKSPLPSWIHPTVTGLPVDTEKSLTDLINRCPECEARYAELRAV